MQLTAISIREFVPSLGLIDDRIYLRHVIVEFTLCAVRDTESVLHEVGTIPVNRKA